jgi:UDPglucose 6-dehydrogenase
MARVVIVGGGVVGAATGQGFHQQGHEVTVVDTDPDRLEVLHNRGLDAASTIDLRGQAAFVFVTLPTPARAGSEYDLTTLRSGIASIGSAMAESTASHTVVVRSTVPPGTSDRLVVPQLEEFSGRQAGRDFFVASAPEFLRSHCALSDFLSPWVTVLACRQRQALNSLVELFLPFGGSMHTFDNPTVAEFIKVAHNAFNATKISFWNEMWLVCQTLEIDANDVANTVAQSAEGSTNPLYGIRGGYPFGSGCLPKDVEGLLGFGEAMGVDLPLLRSVKLVNDDMAERAGGSSRADTGRTQPMPEPPTVVTAT